MRLLPAFVWLFLSLAVLYAVVVNIFLSTSLFAKVVNAQPDTIDIHYERAWSLVPWKIHASKISVRGRDGNVEWILRLDEVEFGVSFAALAKMRFEGTRVRGKGASFRLRGRLAAAPVSRDEVAGLPPIEGLPPYSIRPPKELSPAEWSDAHYDLWAVRLEDVVADDVREVWIDHARFEGSARIDGRFFLKPMRSVEVGPTRISVARGGVRTSDGPIAEALDGNLLELTLARFDPRTVGGADLLGRVSLQGNAHATLPDLARLPVFPRGVTVQGAAEVRRAVLYVRNGVLEKESHFEGTATPVVVAGAGYRATGALALQADVARESANQGDRLTFRADATNLVVFQGERVVAPTTPFLSAPRAETRGDARALDLAHLFEDLHLVVELADGDLPNARALSGYIPASAAVAVEGGRARATGRLEAWFAEKRATGSAALRAENLDLHIAKIRVRGHTSVRARFSSYHFGTRFLDDATVALTVTDGSVASDAAPGVPLVHVDGLHLDARGHHVDLGDPLGALDVAIAMPTADIVAPDLLHAYLPKGSRMHLVSGHAHFSLEGKLVLSHHLARGRLAIESKGMTGAYRDLRLDADVGVRARVHDWHWESGDLALDDARVDVSHLTITKRRSEDGGARPGVSFARIVLAAKSARFVIDDPLAEVSMSASFVDAKVHDHAALSALFPERTALAIESDEGDFNAELRADVHGHVAKGQVRARAHHMGAGSPSVHVGGDVDLFADVAGWDFDKGTMSLTDSRVTVTRVEGRFHPEGGPEFSAARVALEAHVTRFDLERPTLRDGDFHLVIEDGLLPDARALGARLPPGSAVGIESGTARGSANLLVSDLRHSAAGTVDVTLANGAVRLAGTRLSGDFHVNAGLRGFSPEGDLLGLSDARLEVRNVAVSGASAPTSAWRGDVTFSHATLRLAPAPQLDGVVSVDARDARPLLAILFGNDFPKLLVRLTDVPHLVGSARLTVGANELAILDLNAGGGDVALRGSYAAIGNRRRGGVVATKCFLSLGLRLDDAGTHLRFFGLNGWMRDQRRAVVKLLEAQPPR
ncbi:MAG TPA: hypothetical protein VN894_14150 [Polyangiaceae bacterium]|nr:hypothetical protein [Polyangiaceae bacterium]